MNITGFMATNLLLAFIPLLISLIIFRKQLWDSSGLMKLFIIIGGVIFYLFLPNAPYVYTDLIHLVRQIMDYRYFKLTQNSIIIFLIPQYMLFIFLGFSFYVLSFQKMLHFLLDCNVKIRTIWLIKIINPIIMGVGVFLGRVRRFNSWDLFFNSDEVIKSTIAEFSNLDFIIYVFYNSFVIFLGFEILSIFYKSLFNNLFDMKIKENSDGEKHV